MRYTFVKGSVHRESYYNPYTQPAGQTDSQTDGHTYGKTDEQTYGYSGLVNKIVQKKL